MDTSKKAESDHLLDDLESIRQLLGDDGLQPPLLTDTVRTEGQIPLLFDVVGSRQDVIEPHEHEPEAPPVPTAAEPASVPEDKAASNADALLYLDRELRAAAELIMQDVIDDFAPHIETEIKRRLDARLERLLSQYQG